MFYILTLLSKEQRNFTELTHTEFLHFSASSLFMGILYSLGQEPRGGDNRIVPSAEPEPGGTHQVFIYLFANSGFLSHNSTI